MTSWRHPAIQAVEIWNYMHNLVDQFLPWRLREAYRLLTRPRAHISAPDARVLAIWDRLARKRSVAGISGLDCHTFSVPLTRLELFPYEDLFATVRTHVLAPPSFAGASEGRPALCGTGGDRHARRDASPSPVRQEQVLLEAIRQSRCFVANDYVADARGTRYWAECACGATLSMGDRHVCRGRATLRVSLPRAALIRIICDGRSVAERQASSLDAPADLPGVYRVEAYLDGKPWIFTNHIALLSADESREASACPTN